MHKRRIADLSNNCIPIFGPHCICVDVIQNYGVLAFNFSVSDLLVFILERIFSCETYTDREILFRTISWMKSSFCKIELELANSFFFFFFSFMQFSNLLWNFTNSSTACTTGTIHFLFYHFFYSILNNFQIVFILHNNYYSDYADKINVIILSDALNHINTNSILN